MKAARNVVSAEAWRSGNDQTDSELQSPLYQQVYLVIRDRILNGVYPDQSLLPGEHELADLFDVSRITAKRALNEIAAEGLCVRKKGQGSRVTYKPSVAPLKTDVQGLLDYLFQMNLESEGSVLEFEYIPATEEIAKILKCDEGAEVQRSVRLRQVGGTPFSYLTTFVPADIGRNYKRENLASQAVLTVLEKIGIEVARADQTITATLAGAVVAKAMDVKPGSPLLRISRIVFDRNERVVEYIVGLYRPDQYQYRTMLSRVSTGNKTAWSEDR